MVNNTWRDRVHVKVSHLVCSYDHSALLLAECVDDLLKGLRAAIYVIAVKLDGVFAAFLVVHSQIPATSYAKIVSCRNHMDQSFILRGKFLQKLEGAVGRVVVDHYDIIWEVRLLTESTQHSVLYSPDSVEYRYNYSRCHREFMLSEIRRIRILELRFQISSDPLEVLCTDLLHFDLHRPVLRVNIVKLLLA